ncbi:hypothetical protein F2P81_015327 [Scophthalmus maximus]|uniref:Uncharacterized protein n=1 Tax=Scophthalmus maximus TaxID=52904 RepID=A0A6A4SIG0_SCOMX|nr:hypothetical protein F2P81_015327 [Scophthalmus maximus]
MPSSFPQSLFGKHAKQQDPVWDVISTMSNVAQQNPVQEDLGLGSFSFRKEKETIQLLLHDSSPSDGPPVVRGSVQGRRWKDKSRIELVHRRYVLHHTVPRCGGEEVHRHWTWRKTPPPACTTSSGLLAAATRREGEGGTDGTERGGNDESEEGRGDFCSGEEWKTFHFSFRSFCSPLLRCGNGHEEEDGSRETRNRDRRLIRRQI